MEPRNTLLAGGGGCANSERHMGCTVIARCNPPCRSRRAHHAQKDRVGTWEVPRLAVSEGSWRSASGRRGAEADDARAREVGRGRSGDEAGERSGAIRGGVGGAKGRGRGECEPAKHVPGTEPGRRVTGAGAHTAKSEREERGEVHLA